MEYVASTAAKAKTITIPSTIVAQDGTVYKVTSIGSNAMKKAKKVTKIVVGSNVSNISKNAFKNAKTLTSIVIGKNVKTIGATAFTGCKKLKTITFKTTKLTNKSVAKKALKGIKTKVTIKVPKKSLKSYRKLFVKKGLSSKVKVRK